MLNKTLKDSLAKTASAPRAILIGVGLVFVGCVMWALARSEPVLVRTDCEVNTKLETVTISSEGTSIQAEVVTSGEDKARGLSGRNCLNPDTGMLFLYELSGDYCFWMKDMNFSIDMIWMDDEKRIVTIKDSVSPETYPQSFCPEKPSQYILEVAPGFTAKAGWSIGTQLNW